MVEIRKARYQDCEAFVQWENDEEVIKYLSIPRGKTLEMTIREFIQRESDDSVMDFGVYYQDKIIGRAFLSRYDRVSHSIDITRIYLGDSSNRGKGLGTDMMKLLRSMRRFCSLTHGLLIASTIWQRHGLERGRYSGCRAGTTNPSWPTIKLWSWTPGIQRMFGLEEAG